MRPRLLAAFFLVAFFLQGIFLIRAMSATADEVPFHVVNGYTYLKTRDYRMSPANPALIREWLALPLLWLHPRLDLNKASWKEADSAPFAFDFFYKDNRAIAGRMLNWARFMNLLLGLALDGVIFVWSRALYGSWGGALSLGFYAFCPNFLAHASIAHTDIGVTLFTTAAAFFVWRHLEHSRPADRWLAAAAFGFACAAKYNALMFGPVFLGVLWFKKGFRAFMKTAAVFAAAAFLVIWASYGFEFKPVLAGGVPRVEEKLADVSAISKTLLPGNDAAEKNLRRAALELSVPHPTYLLGAAAIAKAHRSPYLHYAFGEWTTQPRWYYYLFSFAVKMTLPFLTLLLIRVFFIGKKFTVSRNENAMLLTPAGALFLATCFDSAQVGVRYLFPVIPLLFVWVGGLARWAQGSAVRRRLLGTLFILNLATTLPSFPNYLSYFNPLAAALGGGYRTVRGSDVDWGQGLKALKKFMDREKIESVTLRYFGPSDPSFYGIRFEPLPEAERFKPQKKVYAISLFYLEHAEWSKRFKPTALVGGSIFIYDFRQ